MKRNAFVFAALFVLILGMVAFGKYVDRARKHGAPKLIGKVEGMHAPDFTLASLDGRKVKLSDYRGKAVVLNFWATWCAPCKVEMPWFEEFQKQYGKDGLVVLGVAMDDSEASKIADFAHEMGVNYQVLLGTDQVSDDYGDIQYFPTTYYIDRNGIIVQKSTGLFSRQDIEDHIKKILSTSLNSPAEQAKLPGAISPEPRERVAAR